MGHFRKKLCSPMRGDCPTFISKSLFSFGYKIPPLGTIKINDLRFRCCGAIQNYRQCIGTAAKTDPQKHKLKKPHSRQG